MKYVRNDGQLRMRKLFTSGARYNLTYGGSRSGKTYEIVGTIIERALYAPKSRHLIVRQEATSAKRAIVKGTWPEVVNHRFKGAGGVWKEQYGYFELPNGSEVWVGGLNDEKALEKILGNEYSTIYMNEASECRYSAYTLLQTRLAQTAETINSKELSQRFYIDLNPTTRKHWTYRLFIDGNDPDSSLPIDSENYGSVVVNPHDNKANLSKEYLKSLENLPPHAKRRFLKGEYAADAQDALWRRSVILRCQNPPPLNQVVVAVDPAISNEAGSDETGILCMGVDAGGNGYLLADDSGKYKPEQWARRALALHDMYEADCIVAEKNQGGDMVESTIRAIRSNFAYVGVTATRGKAVRATPVSALYERGMIYHCEEFSDLEDQMCSFTIDFDRKKAGYSPDRVDALVWGFSKLFSLMTIKNHDNDIVLPQAFSAFR